MEAVQLGGKCTDTSSDATSVDHVANLARIRDERQNQYPFFIDQAMIALAISQLHPLAYLLFLLGQ